MIQHSAGGVVYRSNGQGVDVCMIKDSYGRWTFPKGHVEANETLEETARREIAEETGIDQTALHLQKELGEINYWFISNYDRDTGKTGGKPVKIHKYVTYYLYDVPFDTELTPQQGEVDDIAWIPLSEIDRHNEYEDNLPIIKAAKNYLT
jgi:8-oxo-dGTP pyrophosphatase MutT (NUDIX family)